MISMSTQQVGLLIIALGLGVALVGFLIWCGAFAWFGHLPGDIRVERETTRIYVPITSMLLVSVILSLVLYLIRRFF
jgi:hypothetical protein